MTARGRAGSIAIVETWSVLRRGLRSVLGRYDVRAEVDAVADVLPLLARDEVDLVLLGPSTAADLPSWLSYARAASSTARLVALVDDIDAHRLAQALRDGAQAVLAKTVEDDELLDALERVRRGERVVDQRFLPLLFNGELESPPVVDIRTGAGEAVDAMTSTLTDREREVLVQLAKGSTNREIASCLVVGESTVKTHLSSIYDKLEVDSRHRAVWRAIELGILQ